VLTPVRLHRSDTIRTELGELGITPDDVACNTSRKRHARRQQPCAETSRPAAASRTSASLNLGA
jgi:hypothetical protein